jgi:ribonucleoside-diphosphate reductase alpha chain
MMKRNLFTLNPHLINRYLLKNTTLTERFKKISKLVSNQENNEPCKKLYNKNFFKIMNNGSFLPAGNTLVATEKSIYPNCAIYGDIHENNIDIKRLTNLWSNSIGLGFQFDKCKNPINVLKKLSEINSKIDLLHRPQRGNFGTLSWDHPCIKEFINCKNDNPDSIYNFNISVTLDKDFWVNYNNKDYNALKIMNLISEGIYNTGDPGLLFIDNIHKNIPFINKTIEPPLGELNTLVPCGEQTMYSNETCNLGSINLNSPYFDNVNTDEIIHFKNFKHVIYNSIRFLDNVVDILEIPDKQMEKRTKQIRRIGLGVSGFADLLIKKNIKYGSDESFEYAEKISSILSQESELYNELLSFEKGPNELLNNKRNHTITCLPPTGGISLLWGNQGFSIEPSFEDAINIDYKDHIKMVKIWQNNIDNSISKTINIKNNFDIKLIPEIIVNAYQNNLKCVTIYRDKSRENQPMNKILCETC